MPGNPVLLPQTFNGQRVHIPGAQPNAFQTWSTRFYWRQATCAEANCEAYQNGWVTAVNEATELGRQQADYIRHHAGRAYTQGIGDNGFTLFEFPAGQTCFAAEKHKIQAEMAPQFSRAAGDWRKRGQAYVYDRGDQFADDLHTHTDRLITQ